MAVTTAERNALIAALVKETTSGRYALDSANGKIYPNNGGSGDFGGYSIVGECGLRYRDCGEMITVTIGRRAMTTILRHFRP